MLQKWGRFSVTNDCVFGGLGGDYLVKLRSGWGLLPLLRSQREEVESREGSVEDADEVELRLGWGVGRLFLLLRP